MNVEIPEISESTDRAEVARVLVSVGDRVDKDQPLLELESDKASFELPSPVAGTIEEIHVESGAEVKVGEVAFTIADGEAEADDEASPKKKERKGREKRTKPEPKGEVKAKDSRRAPLEAGHDTDLEDPEQEEESEDEAREDEAKDEAREDEAEGKEEVEAQERQEPAQERQEPAQERQEPAQERQEPVRAAPSTRKLARELGVDLRKLAKKGERIGPDDVKGYVRKPGDERRDAGGDDGQAERRANGGAGQPDFSRWGSVHKQSLSRLRRTAAERLSHSWRTIPHVTQHDLCDITELEAARKRHQERRGQDAQLTITALAAKAVVVALGEFPTFNSSLAEDGRELVIKDYVNLGIAVDTERGLLVPVVEKAESLSLAELAEAIERLAGEAREGKLKGRQMEGASFTLTNLGGLGGSFFTPIIPPHEVAILGLSRARKGVYAESAEESERLLLPLSLSYDHRVIDGADAMRFVRRLGELLAEPLELLLAA